MNEKKKKKSTIEIWVLIGLIVATLLVAFIGSREQLIVGAICFALFGAVMLIMGLCYQSVAKKKLGRCSQRAEGTVVETWEGEDTMPGEEQRFKVWMWYIGYSFSVGTTAFTIRTPKKVGELPFKEGDKVHVCYNPDHPQDCILEEQQPKTNYRTYVVIGIELFIAAVLAAVLACV